MKVVEFSLFRRPKKKTSKNAKFSLFHRAIYKGLYRGYRVYKPIYEDYIEVYI